MLVMLHGPLRGLYSLNATVKTSDRSQGCTSAFAPKDLDVKIDVHMLFTCFFTLAVVSPVGTQCKCAQNVPSRH